MQNVYPHFLIWEFERYTDLQNALGVPDTSFTTIIGIVLRLYFHLLHAVIGGIIGFLIFHFRYRYVGYIISLSKRARILISVLLLLLLFFFIRIDLFDQFLSSQKRALTQTVDAVSFLRSLFSPPEVILEKGDEFDEGEEVEDTAPVSDPKERESGQEGVIRPSEQMATPRALYEALNDYRQAHNVRTLIWDNKLANFAQKRASTFVTRGGDDHHKGFEEYLQKQNGFALLGFDDVAENSAYLLGSQASGQRIINEYFAQSEEHDINQLEPTFTHVGVGVSGISVDVVFGGQKSPR